MIPQLKHVNPTQAHYLTFLQALRTRGFNGELCPDYANRTVLATDNSIYEVLPQGVIYPRTTDDIVELCQLLHQEEYRDIVVSPRGGGTGTNGQSLTDGLIVDLSKHMNKVLDINVSERWVKVQAGVVKDQLNAAVREHGLFFAPELSTSNRATIGGMINTDASGQGSCLYGKTRDHVLELQTVLLDGSTLHSQALNEESLAACSDKQDRSGLIHRLINNIDTENKQQIEAGFPKLNRCLTGYDLAHIRDENGQFNLNNILCGSEGTLGFITEAKLNLLPIPKVSSLIIVKYADFEASLRDATALMQCAPTSIETIDSKVLNLAMDDFIWHQVDTFFKDKTPVPLKGINLVEFTAATPSELDHNMQGLLKQLKENTHPARIGYAIAAGHEAVNNIWAMRKRAVGLLGNASGEARPVPFVEDTAVPPENLADFIMEFRAILDRHQLSYGMFGHVDAGVLHVRPALDMKNPKDEKLAWEISDQVASLTQKYHGLLWGEHGKGVRSAYAPKFFGELYPLLQRIKSAFDPHNQLNPGKIATPNASQALLDIHEVTTRGQLDREIPIQSWDHFKEAVYCNGNGACHNWNHNDFMCPSWKGTRLRTHTPKGRASLLKEWLRQLADQNYSASKQSGSSLFTSILLFPKKIANSLGAKFGDYDFSHEVYNSMAGCLACKSCTGQCPIKVDVPEFRAKFLSLYHTRYLRPIKDYLVGSLEFLLPVLGKAPGLYNSIMSLPPITYLLKHLAGFVDGPRISGISLKKHGVELANFKKLQAASDEEKARTVILVQDAFTRWFETELVIDTIKCLKALGFKPLLAPYAANGKPLHVHGFLNTFKKVASNNAQMLKRFSNLGLDLVGLDPSMTLTYRAEYLKYLPEDSVPPVLLLQEWFNQKIQQKQLHLTPKAQQGKTFKLLPHCTESTNATASSAQWKKIFSALGAELDVLPAGCCGMAGTYGHEARNRETAKIIYEQSWKLQIDKHQPSHQLLATGYSCRCQAKREQNASLSHPIQAIQQLIGTP